MLSTSIRFSSYALTAMTLALFGSSGCAGQEDNEDPTVAAVEAIADGTEAAHALGRPGMGGIANPQDFVRNLAAQCDASPDITNMDVCGRTIPQSAHFEWSNCQPVSADAVGHPVGSMSGEVDVTNSVTLDPRTDCAEGAEATYEHAAAFAMQRQIRWGTVVVSGSATSSSTHAFGAMNYVRSTSMEMTREMKDSNGDVVRSMHIEGSLNVAVDDGANAPTQTINGTIQVDFADGRSGTVTLTDVVRVDPATCRFPVGGTAARSVDGESHTVVFSSQCGQATIDGAAVDLSQQQFGRGRPH